jgi:putative oxidoreductase
MTDIATNEPKTKTRIIALWGLRTLVAALFLPPAVMKITGQPMMVQEFDAIGLGQWFRYFTAMMEMAGFILVLTPRFSVFGAILVLLVDIGAFFAQALILHGDVIHTIILALPICALIYLQRAQLLKASAGRS